MLLDNLNTFISHGSRLGSAVYQGLRAAHFHVVSGAVKTLNAVGLQAIGAMVGMLALEPGTLVKATKHSYWDYRGEPEQYQLDAYVAAAEKRPILLLHGAAGSWNYMGDLATELKNKGYPVFVISLGMGIPGEDERQRVMHKIEAIRNLYLNNNEEAPRVDLVAHSMGANVALAAAFTPDTVGLVDGSITHTHAIPGANANDYVGKVITLANPTEEHELEMFREALKAGDLYNITAKYDALMGHKTPALTERIHELDAKHIDIVYHQNLADRIAGFLN